MSKSPKDTVTVNEDQVATTANTQHDQITQLINELNITGDDTTEPAFDFAGFNKEGYDKDGYNCDGVNKDGISRFTRIQNDNAQDNEIATDLIGGDNTDC